MAIFFIAVMGLFSGCATPPASTPAAPVETPATLPGGPQTSATPASPPARERQPKPRVQIMVPTPAAEIQVEEELTAADTSELEKMAAEGRFLDAALAYIKLAAKYPSPLRERYTVSAAELLMTGNYAPQAGQLLQDLDKQGLGDELELRYAILQAGIALARENPQATINHLGAEIFFLSKAYPRHISNIHRLRATAFEQTGNYLEAARERAELDLFLSHEDAIEQNQQAILQNLDRLSPEVLLAMRTSAVSDTFSGWLELAAIKQGEQNIQQSNQLLESWRQRYTEHPARENILDGILAALPPMTPLPSQVALILPLKNRFAKAASAVRDGFLAAHFARLQNIGPHPLPGSYIPSIMIYDEGDKPQQIDAVYAQAINQGAQFVVGPLDKDAVNRLSQRAELPVPTLALNFSETSPLTDNSVPHRPPAGLYQMSLSPEQEARQLAERAWLDSHKRAAIITPDSVWGQRVTRAFRERWLQLGGEISEESHYDTRKSDYSLPIRRLLNVDDSEQRKAGLQRLLGEKLEYTPRRRQDIDFIFMAASSRQARLIRPQLRFHHAIELPVYATSHSFSGSINADMDRDMDGVLFADIPWTLEPRHSASAIKQRIEQSWPTEAKLYPRLYALGVDAYNIIGKLQGLNNDRAEYFAGETGDLYLDTDNRLQRRLLWAKFRNGIPRVIDSF